MLQSQILFAWTNLKWFSNCGLLIANQESKIRDSRRSTIYYGTWDDIIVSTRGFGSILKRGCNSAQPAMWTWFVCLFGLQSRGVPSGRRDGMTLDRSCVLQVNVCHVFLTCSFSFFASLSLSFHHLTPDVCFSFPGLLDSDALHGRQNEKLSCFFFSFSFPFLSCFICLTLCFIWFSSLYLFLCQVWPVLNST